MNAIEKTIFDTLAAGRGINLPGIGALYVEQRPAEFISGKSLRPPYNRIAFSPAENPAYPSAGTLEGYEEWALHSQQEGDVREINGVGVLRGGVFYPAVELYELLNPQGTEPVPVKPRYGTGRKLLIGIGVIAVAALVMAVVVQISRFADRKADTGETPAAIRIAREEAAGASSRGESTIAPAVAEEVKEETVADNRTVGTTPGKNAETENRSAGTVATATDMENGTANDAIADEIQRSLEEYASPNVASGPEFHLVAGVFSDPANADRLIAADPLGIGSANYRKVGFSGGKTLVSVFSSTDRAAVEARKRALAGVNNELWIYEKP